MFVLESTEVPCRFLFCEVGFDTFLARLPEFISSLSRLSYQSTSHEFSPAQTWRLYLAEEHDAARLRLVAQRGMVRYGFEPLMTRGVERLGLGLESVLGLRLGLMLEEVFVFDSKSVRVRVRVRVRLKLKLRVGAQVTVQVRVRVKFEVKVKVKVRVKVKVQFRLRLGLG